MTDIKKLFGTDGIRGKAGEFPLDQASVGLIGAALARILGSDSTGPIKILTGRDTRESGAWIEQSFTAGVVSEGGICQSAGVITTPGVAYLTGEEGFDAGVVISASHNPYYDNGLKVFLPTGKKLDKSRERLIEEAVHLGGEVQSSGIEVDHGGADLLRQKYLAGLKTKFADLEMGGMKIVVDCAHGAASGLAPELFRSFGADVIAINNQPDGRNINLDCGSLHLDGLSGRVVEEGADMGVAFDGDADRSLFVDESGGLVDGDATLWITARYLKDRGVLKGDTVVATVMSNLGLEVALESIGVNLVRTSVGDKYVLEELVNSDFSVGGEQSGHIIFPTRGLVGDGMQTALFLIAALRSQGESLGEGTHGFTKFPQVLVNAHVKEKLPFDEVTAIKNAAESLEQELGETGRLLLRYSGTENLARVMIEGKNQNEIELQANDLAKVIESTLG